MKKVFIILLASFYLAIASGISFSLHYCGGKLKEISFFVKSDEEGCCGKEMKDSNCCKNKQGFIKVKDSHQFTSSLKVSSAKFFTTNFFAPVSEVFYTHQYLVQSDLISDYHAPPVIYDSPIYLKNQVFLI